MFFYLLVVPVFAFSVWIIVQFYKLSKHDIALFLFCDLRRDLMCIIRERGLEMSREEFLALRKLVVQTSSVIRDYNNFKAMLFSIKLSVFLKALFAHVDSAKRFESADASRSAVSDDVRRMQAAYTKALADAILTMVPAKITIFVLTFLVKVIGRIAIKSISRQVNRLMRWRDVLQWAETKSGDWQPT